MSNPVLNEYAANNIAPKCIKQILPELTEEIDKASILVGDLNIHTFVLTEQANTSTSQCLPQGMTHIRSPIKICWLEIIEIHTS